MQRFRTRTTRESPKSCRAFEVYRNSPSRAKLRQKTTGSVFKLLGSCLRGVIGSSPRCRSRFIFIFIFFCCCFFAFATNGQALLKVAVTKLNHECFYLFLALSSFLLCSPGDSRLFNDKSRFNPDRLSIADLVELAPSEHTV